MKSRAAVAFGANQPLQVVEIDVAPPRAGEVLVQGGPAPAGATGIFVGTSSVDYLSVSYE